MFWFDSWVRCTSGDGLELVTCDVKQLYFFKKTRVGGDDLEFSTITVPRPN
jgi:hypothetical protein